MSAAHEGEIQVEQDAGVRVLRLPVHGWSYSLFRALDEHVLGFRLDPTASALVIVLDGGALAERAPWTPAQAAAVALHRSEVVARVAATKKPIIAAIAGPLAPEASVVAAAASVRIGRATPPESVADVYALPAEGLGAWGAGALSSEEARKRGFLHHLFPREGFAAVVQAFAASLSGAAPASPVSPVEPARVEPPRVEPARVEPSRVEPPKPAPKPTPTVSVPIPVRKPAPPPPTAVARVLPAEEPYWEDHPPHQEPDSSDVTEGWPDGGDDWREDAFSTAGGPARKAKSGGGSAAAGNVNDLASARISDAVLNRVPRDLVERWKCIPLRIDGGEMVIAMVDPGNPLAVAELEEEVGMPVRCVAASENDVVIATWRYYRA